MENNGGYSKNWKFAPNKALMTRSSMSIRGIVDEIMSHVDDKNGDERPIIPLGNGDPSVFPCFRIPRSAEDAVVASLRSAEFNGYAPHTGLTEARRAIANYHSRGLPYGLAEDDVYLTNGCVQGIEVVTSVLARPGANILLPRPGYLVYEERAAFCGIEIRHFDLLMDKGWEIDLDGVEALADENTVAMVIVNPCNPCGNVYTYEHLAKVANIAKRLGILVISDEVYGHLTFGCNPFTPMGVFSHIVPVLTLSSISKRWAVPGWRLGWIVANDPNGVLKETKIIECIQNYLDCSANPATFIQAAIPQILNMEEDFFNNTTDILRQTARICYERVKEIDCITCPNKPEGAMFVMVKLHLDQMKNIHDDIDFCCKLAKEERVVILPGCAVGLKNWIRVMFAVERPSLEEGLARLKSFCMRHSIMQHKLR